MAFEHDVMLIGKYEGDPSDEQKAKDQPRIQNAINEAQQEIAALKLDITTPEGIEKANNCIKTSVDALGIPNFSVQVIQASEAALDRMTNLPDEVREGVRHALEITRKMKAEGHSMEDIVSMMSGGDRHNVRMEALKALSTVLAHYAVSRGTTIENGGAPDMFHDIGALLAASMLSIGKGVLVMGDKGTAVDPAKDPFVGPVVELCNRIALMSFVGYLTSEHDVNRTIGIDREAMIADIRAVLDGKTEDRLKEIGETMSSFSQAFEHKRNGTLN